MSDHEKLKRIELADGVGDAIDALIARAADAGEVIWTVQAVQHIQAEFPDAEVSPAELAEAVVRAAVARGLPIAIQNVD
jgi:hypothetical protein